MKEVFQKQKNKDRSANEEASKQPLKIIVRDVRDPIIGYEDLIEYKPPNDRDPYLYKCKLCRVRLYRVGQIRTNSSNIGHILLYYWLRDMQVGSKYFWELTGLIYDT